MTVCHCRFVVHVAVSFPAKLYHTFFLFQISLLFSVQKAQRASHEDECADYQTLERSEFLHLGNVLEQMQADTGDLFSATSRFQKG